MHSPRSNFYLTVPSKESTISNFQIKFVLQDVKNEPVSTTNLYFESNVKADIK